MVQNLGPDYDQLRSAAEVVQVYPFSPTVKRMSTIIKTGAVNRIYVKVF